MRWMKELVCKIIITAHNLYIHSLLMSLISVLKEIEGHAIFQHYNLALNVPESICYKDIHFCILFSITGRTALIQSS